MKVVDIHKTFDGVAANDGISLEIPDGSIQGILGENGAGKSTLMKILSGFIQADRGHIIIDKNIVSIKSPSDGIKNGIGMLHQDPLDFPSMKVIDNFLLGRREALFPSRKSAEEKLREIASRFDFSLDPNADQSSLTVGERQQLEIVRLISLGVKILILDEPTTGISGAQKEKLFAALRNMARDGATIIFVSHKLEEVQGLCDSVAVLREGRLIGEAKPPYSTEALVEMMFGKTIPRPTRESKTKDEIIFELENLVSEDAKLNIGPVSVNIQSGEVIGLAGMEGSGQKIFMRACSGLKLSTSKRADLAGRDIKNKGYHACMREGLSYVPAARLEEGLVPGMSIIDHVLLSDERSSFFIDADKGAQLALQKIAEFSVKGEPTSTVESLSGGNQQRVLLSLVSDASRLVLLEQPTRGLDVESAISIWKKLKNHCERGAAVIFTSSDLDELMQYSDRIIVFFHGKASAPIDAKDATVEMLGQLIGGKGFRDL